MQLRRGVAVHGPRAVMLKLRRYPFAGCFCRKISADAGLDVSLQFVQRDGHAFLMCRAHPFVSADKRSQRHALRCGERRIPTRAVLHRPYLLAVFVHVFPCRFVADKLLARDRVLAFREPLEVFLAHLSSQSPLLGKPAVPFAAYLIALRVVVLACVRELFRVIRLRLARAQRIRDGQHVVTYSKKCSCVGPTVWPN